jgi:acyl carrier protein phosphodiesterase
VIMGNFVGDFIKGKLTPERTTLWTENYLSGILLHRFVDHFTDTHPVIRSAKAVLSNTHPKVAGVALDMYLDYFLANHFSYFHQEGLYDFTRSAYRIIERNRQLIPEAMLPMADAMVRHDWLYNYKEIAGIKRSFDGLANRFAFMGRIRGAEQELVRNMPLYERAFLTFYPELKAAADVFLQNYQPN